MNELLGFWHQYPHLAGWIAVAIFNAAVTTMPSPTKDSNPIYRWVFDFSHALVLLIPRIIQTRKAASAAGGDSVPNP